MHQHVHVVLCPCQDQFQVRGGKNPESETHEVIDNFIAAPETDESNARPIRKASTATRTLIEQIAISHLAEQTDEEVNDSDTKDRESNYQSEAVESDESGSDPELDAELISIRRQVAAVHNVTRKAKRRRSPTDSDSEDDVDGKFLNVVEPQ